MTDFYNPYQFIPVTGRIDGQPSARLPYTDIGTDSCHCRHDLWVAGAHSGRIVCRLTLETPTVVGANQEGDENTSKLVTPYRRDGQPAIPGSSLRGMVGSVLETLSQSALRVLENRYYSVRVPARKEGPEGSRPLSALGRLVPSRSNPKGFDLVPLTIPTLEAQGNKYRLDEVWEIVFRDKPLGECLGAYIDGYTRSNSRLDYSPASFLEKQRPDSFHPKRKNYYYARLFSLPRQMVTNDIATTLVGLNQKVVRIQHGEMRFLLGQKIENGRDSVISQQEWKVLPEAEQANYTKGFLRVLGIDGRESTIPTTKKHEIFIPCQSQNFRIRISDEAIARFIRLGEEREKASAKDTPKLPLHLKGYDSLGPGTYKPWEPQPDMIVFFDAALDEKSRLPYVCEISLSSIWRKEVDGTAHDFFGAIDTSLLPWNRDRDDLTPAEALLGVVDEDKAGETDTARALASRLRFSDALYAADKKPELLREYTLKIQSSPKPPCPSMYFHPRNQPGNYVPKTSLSKQQHQPNGRKVYLHHPNELAAARGQGIGETWETRSGENANQKLRCTPLAAGQDFFFHIDFDNLSKAELTLLLAAITPSDGFLHRLGLGKALGLGSVEVKIEGVFFISRSKRYGKTALNEPRYHSVWRPEAVSAEIDWRKNYPEEAERLCSQIPGDTGESRAISPMEDFRDNSLIDVNTRKLLESLGNPDRYMDATLKVHTPLLESQLASPENEKETFKWFVENDDGGRRALSPVRPHQPLEPLSSRPSAVARIEPNRNQPRPRNRR